MEPFHLTFAWAWILAGLVSGTIVGIFFHDDGWLGGYASWPRRMVRLGHVSFLGTGLLNLAFVLSVSHAGQTAAPRAAAVLFVTGAVTMPLVCYLSAWRKGMRHLFFVPVLSLIGATVDLLWHGLG